MINRVLCAQLKYLKLKRKILFALNLKLNAFKFSFVSCDWNFFFLLSDMNKLIPLKGYSLSLFFMLYCLLSLSVSLQRLARISTISHKRVKYRQLIGLGAGNCCALNESHSRLYRAAYKGNNALPTQHPPLSCRKNLHPPSHALFATLHAKGMLQLKTSGGTTHLKKDWAKINFAKGYT